MTEVIEELLHALTEFLIHSILVELISNEFEFVQDAISVVAITVEKVRGQYHQLKKQNKKNEWRLWKEVSWLVAFAVPASGMGIITARDG